MKVPKKMMPKVAAAKKKEAHESRAEEKRESPTYQRFEKKYGVEKHKGR